MTRFLVPHLRHDGARLVITLRQAFQVTRQMGFNLMFGFRHKPEAQAVAQPAGNQAEPKGTGVPQRIEQGGPRAQLVHPVLGPGQVVAFFLAGLQEFLAQNRVARSQRLRGIQRLRANFAHVVDPHQRARQGFVLLAQVGRLGRHGGAGPGGARLGKQGVQGIVSGGQCGVQQCHGGLSL